MIYHKEGICSSYTIYKQLLASLNALTGLSNRINWQNSPHSLKTQGRPKLHSSLRELITLPILLTQAEVVYLSPMGETLIQFHKLILSSILNCWDASTTLPHPQLVFFHRSDQLLDGSYIAIELLVGAPLPNNPTGLSSPPPN